MWLKVISLAMAVFEAVPHIKEMYLKFLEDRAKKKLSDALAKVDQAKTKEGIKDAVSEASRALNRLD
jgi:hypothetical protein